MLQTRGLVRVVRKMVVAPKRRGTGFVRKRGLSTTFPRMSQKTVGGAQKPKNPCRVDCPTPKVKIPCVKPPCPVPEAACPLNDPCFHCPYTPPPCPKQAHRCCPVPPCVPNPKEYKLVCCEKSNDLVKQFGKNECDTCEKKPECCPCEPCATNNNNNKKKKKKMDCCPAELQQKHLCNRPPAKKPLKRCERPEACDDPCCPRVPCCPEPCDKKTGDPCKKQCESRCPRPQIPDICSELGIICGPEKECEFKHPKRCPKPCDRRHKEEKTRKPNPPPCCLDLDPNWPPKRPQCDAECLSPDPCNPCQQKCKQKQPFWDGL